MNPLAIIGKVADVFGSVINSRSDRKKLKISTLAKLAQAKESNKTDITLRDAEWESVNANKADGTWKDEFVTIVILWPYIQLFIGGLYLAFKGDDRILTALTESLKVLEGMGVDQGFLMSSVVLAAVGLKVWRA